MTNHSHPVIRKLGTAKKYEPRPVKVLEKVLPMPLFPTVDFDVTAIVVNFKTEKLIRQAVLTFREFYPNVNLIIIDNASRDSSTEWIRSTASKTTFPVVLDKNIGHGPALALAMDACPSKYVFIFDSDVEFHHGNFLEKMLELMEENYAVGWLRWVNRNGVAARGTFDENLLCPYVHPCFAMIDVSVYRKLKPFVNKGAPFVDNMHDAKIKGYTVDDFPYEEYADHLVAGTRRLYRGHWWGKDEPPKEEWNPDAQIPI